MQIVTKIKYHLTYNGYCEKAKRNKLVLVKVKMRGDPHSLSKGMQISEVAKENKMGVPKTRTRTS